MKKDQGVIGGLSSLAAKTEAAVLRDNIYYDKTFRSLILFEQKVNDIAKQIGLSVEELLHNAAVESPFDLLNKSIRHWDKKLALEVVPSDEALIEHLRSEFRVKVHKVDQGFLPPDKHECPENPMTSEGKVMPDDANRVSMALHTLLNTEINGLAIRLDNLEINVGEIPDDSFRRRPYWLITISNYRIGILLNNQTGNRTFIFTYRSDEELAEIVKGGKNNLKSGLPVGNLVQHFPYYNQSQFIEDLKSNLAKIVAGKGIRKMDKEYFENPENIRSDLQKFCLAKGLADLRPLTPHAMDTVKTVECSNGEVVKGKTYLSRAGVVLGIVSNSDEAACNKPFVLDYLKRLLGIEVVEKKTFPKMDISYFNPETVLRDLESFRVTVGLASLELLTTKHLDTHRILAANGEEISGTIYLARVAKTMQWIAEYKNARKHGSVILSKLKVLAGLKVEELEIYPDMDKAYFSPENVLVDLDEYRKLLGVESISDLNTNQMNKLPAIRCQNGEMVTGQTYVYRAGKALGFGKTGRAAHARLGEVLNALKVLAGLQVEEVKVYPTMDSAYFTPETILSDLKGFAEKLAVPVEELNVSKMSQAGFLECANGESIIGSTYLLRAGVVFGFGKSRRTANQHLGEIITHLKKLALAGTN